MIEVIGRLLRATGTAPLLQVDTRNDFYHC
jgi:hypothetical protein